MTDQTTLLKALYSIRKLKAELQERKDKAFAPIAIIGLGCRFPEVNGKEAYWEMLSQGQNKISKLSEARWELLKNTDEILLRDKNHPYWGGFLSNIDEFDAYRFDISPREAARMDPQHRLLLEVTHEAIEDAGIPLDALAGTKTGVFASLYVSQLAHLQKMDTEMDALYLPTGNAISIAANRISYLFDLRGPSLVIDSACSSSMTSLYLACLNLQSDTCTQAIVCGAKLNLLPYVNYVLTKANMLSLDGQCQTFDAKANGYVQGEGVGAIILKPLEKALADKDRIYAVITGAAINQDGRTNGLTAPNGLQQEQLLKAAYSSAKIDPNDLSYIECHGTGTFLGDPIEVQALGEVISQQRSSQNPCWIGSVKTNIGHLEGAAGMASVIKVALALNKSQIPPHLNFNEPNPHINFDQYHLRVPIRLESWPKYGDYRLAGLSGFGFGGANAHIVLRELSEEEKLRTAPIVTHENPLELFTISAKNRSVLKELISKWCRYLESEKTLALAQICYNTHIRRQHHSDRLAIIAENTQTLYSHLCHLRDQSDYRHKNIFLSEENQKRIKAQSCEEFSDKDLNALATLYVNHAKINWKKFEEKRYYPHIDMPLYPWQHKSYWPPLGNKIKTEQVSSHPLQGKQLFSPLNSVSFEFKVSLEQLPDLKDTYNILHAGYYLEMIAYAYQGMTSQKTFTLVDHQFISPLIANQNSTTIQLILEPMEEDYLFNFYSRGETNQWMKHASGKIVPNRESMMLEESIESIKTRCPLKENANQLYERISAMGMPAGESIRWTSHYWVGNREILCQFQQPAVTDHNDLFNLMIHPSVFDASIQPVFRLLPTEFTRPYIASSARKMHFFGNVCQPLYLWGKLKEIESTGEKISADCYLINAKGGVVAYLESITLTPLQNRIQFDKIMDQDAQMNLSLSNLTPEELRSRILEYLMSQAANIFSLPRDDIRSHQSLRELGIDSLMALVLVRAIEVGLAVNYPLQDLLEGPTFEEMTDFILKDLKAASPCEPIEPSVAKVNHNRWIAYRQKLSRPKWRILCLPYGGGGASIYRDWQKNFPEEVEICPIQLPGREERMDESPISDIYTLVDKLIENLREEFECPFAFLGHSFGSLIAFELAQQLRKRKLPQPSHLFISAFPDPRVPTKSLDKLLEQLRGLHVTLADIESRGAIEKLTEAQVEGISNILNENGVMGYGKYLLDKEMMKVLLPIFVGDMNIVKSYRYTDQGPLDFPMCVFAGKRDTWVSYEEHLTWQDHTQQSCEIVCFDSGHLFIREEIYKMEMIQKIISCYELTQRAMVDD